MNTIISKFAHLSWGIIVVHQLPVNRQTLWLRILGRDKVQQNAIEELRNLPSDYSHRDNVIELVCKLSTATQLFFILKVLDIAYQPNI